MNNQPRRVGAAKISRFPEDSKAWSRHLQDLIDPSWRPGEFDHESLVFTPDVSNPFTAVTTCIRMDCGILLTGGSLCPSCWKEWVSISGNETALESWAAITPRRRAASKVRGCLVSGCERQHSAQGLCHTHLSAYHNRRRRPNAEPGAPRRISPESYSIQDWITGSNPSPLPPATRCLADACRNDRRHKSGLCGTHDWRFKKWVAATRPSSALNDSVLRWLQLEIEPSVHQDTEETFAAAGATPFMLLPEPLRWEFLYAVQQRDLTGLSALSGLLVRGTFLDLRRRGRTTVVGETKLGRQTGKNGNLTGMLVEWQRMIDEAHRAWSGIDKRDPRLIYFQDLELRKSTQRIGPKARIDLRPMKHEWIAEAITLWTRASARSAGELRTMAAAWQVADETLALRGTPIHALGTADMTEIVRAIRRRWPSEAPQRKGIRAIERLINFARSCEDLDASWSELSLRFVVNPELHLTIGRSREDDSATDEPYRFVPMPIVDWVMDHLGLLERSSAYLTAEARAMIFIQERCGRRTGETVRLEENCISYDDQQSPYLEWRQGKKPWARGKRLPIHQETHDVIRRWQDLKREHQVESQWLFPSRRAGRVDRPYESGYLQARVKELVRLVSSQAPYPTTVEGAEGNLIHFDLATIDAYAFRHAFAQRLADATDEAGRPTTTPEVLQQLMGHRNYNTTMGYFEVTARRRKKAMEAIAPRRLNMRREVIDVTRERDGFNKIAVTLGHCTEPQNVLASGHACALEHSCESCPFFLVDPLEQDGIKTKRHQLRIKLARAKVIESPQHLLDHFEARISDCTTLIEGIDAYVDGLEEEERTAIRHALESMAEIRRRSTASRDIDLRTLLRRGESDAA